MTPNDRDAAVPPPLPEAEVALDAALATPEHLEFKAGLLLLLLLLLVVGAAVYLGYARGAFESTRRVVLVAEDSEGVGVGMDMTFAGFPIGRVRKIELGADGNARILVDVPVSDAHWLRESSVFAIQRGIVGNTNIRAYSGVMSDPPLPDGAVRTVLRGDTAAEIPRVMAEARQLLQNLNAITADGSAVNETLANLKNFSGRLDGKAGAMGALVGGEAQAAKIMATIEQTNRLLARLDGLAAHADRQVFGRDGVMREARAAVQQLGGVLGDARASLVKVDALLVDAKAITGNARSATDDLGALRGEVETSLRDIDQLIDEVHRKWPFARDDELRLK